MNGQQFVVNSEQTLKAAQDHLAKQWKEKKWLSFQLNYDQQRTKPQNSALHVYCSLLSKALNEAGYDMAVMLKHKGEIPWDERGVNVKERLWRPIQESLQQKESTTMANRKDYTQVYEALNNWTGSKLGISIAWPVKGDL